MAAGCSASKEPSRSGRPAARALAVLRGAVRVALDIATLQDSITVDISRLNREAVRTGSRLGVVHNSHREFHGTHVAVAGTLNRGLAIGLCDVRNRRTLHPE